MKIIQDNDILDFPAQPENQTSSFYAFPVRGDTMRTDNQALIILTLIRRNPENVCRYRVPAIKIRYLWSLKTVT